MKIDPNSIKKYPYQLKPDKPDSRDKLFAPKPQSEPLPDSVDLRSKMSPIVDQGSLGSCTANAIASGLGEYLQISEGKPLVPLSRLDLYWQERNIEGTVNEDSGAYLRDGLKVFQKRGIAREVDWPYDISKFTQQPPADADAHAGEHKITEYHRVVTFNDLQVALASGHPVLLGLTVYESFEAYDVWFSGEIPVPDTANEQVLGGHAVLAVGYKQMNGKTYVIFRNSWGQYWGDLGYGYMPIEYFTQGIVTDMWTAIDTTPPAPHVLTYNESIDIICGLDIFNSPDFWKNLGKKYANDTTSDFRYLQAAFIKIATYLNQN